MENCRRFLKCTVDKGYSHFLSSVVKDNNYCILNYITKLAVISFPSVCCCYYSSCLFVLRNQVLSNLERFSIHCRKTKTKEITPTDNKKSKTN